MCLYPPVTKCRRYMLFCEDSSIHGTPRPSMEHKAGYLDNYLLCVTVRPGDPDVKTQAFVQYYQTVSGMVLTVQQQGHTISFLEAELSFDSADLPVCGLRPPVFQFTPGMSNPPTHLRMLDRHSPNAERMLQSHVPHVSAKCSFWPLAEHSSAQAAPLSTLLPSVEKNVCFTVLGFLSKQYPVSWWRPALLQCMGKRDQTQITWNGILAALLDCVT